MANRFTVSFRVVDRASNAFRRIARSTQEIERSSKNASAQFANMAQVTLATTGAMVAGFTSAAAAAGEVEDALARLQTVTRGTAEQIENSLNNAKSAALAFSTEFTASSRELVDAQFQIATAGVAVEEQIAATQGAFKLAVATQGTFAQSTQLLGSLLNTFGKAAEFNYLDPARKVEAITDKLSLAVQRFQVTLPVLAESLKFVIGPASTLGLKFAEVTASLGVLNTAGFRGSLAGTALSNMFNKLDRAVDMLNLDTSKFVDLNGNLKDMASFLEEVERGIAGMTSIEQQNKLIEVFDIRAGRVVKTLLNQVGAIRKNTLEMELNRGATQKMANLQQNTLSAATQKASNAFNNLAITLGDSISPVLKESVVLLTGMAKSFTTAIKAMGPFGSSLISLIATTSAFVAGLTAARVALRAMSAAGFGLVATKVLKLATNMRLLSRYMTLAVIPAIRHLVKVIATRLTTAFIAASRAMTVGLFKAMMNLVPLTWATIKSTGAFIAAEYARIKAMLLSSAGVQALAANLVRLAVTAAIVTGGIYLIVVALGALMSAFIPAMDGADGLNLSLLNISNSIVGVQGQLAQGIDELSRLSKLGKTDVRLLEAGEVGATPLAKMFDELTTATGRSIEKIEKLKERLKNIAPDAAIEVTASMLQFEDQFEGGAAAAKKFAEDMRNVRMSSDAGFKSLDELGRAAVIGSDAMELFRLQINAAAGGNDILAESLLKVNEQLGAIDRASQGMEELLKRLSDAFTGARPFENANERVAVIDQFEAIRDQLPELKKQLATNILDDEFRAQLQRTADKSNPIIAALLNTLNDPQAKSAIANRATEDLGELLVQGMKRAKITDAFSEDMFGAVEFGNLTKALNAAVSRAGSLQEKLEEGAKSAVDVARGVDSALDEAPQKIAQLRSLLSMDLAQSLKNVDNAFKEMSLEEAFQKIQDEVDQLDFRLFEEQLARTAMAWQEQIAKSINAIDPGPLRRELGKLAKDFGEDIGSAVNEFLMGGSRIDLGEAIRDKLGNMVIGNMGQSIAEQLFVGIGPQVIELQGMMREAFNPDNLDISGGFQGIQDKFMQVLGSTELGRALLASMDGVPGQFSKKLMESIQEIQVDLDIMNARRDLDNVSAGFAQELQSVVERSLNDTSVEGLQRSVNNALNLLSEATASGADSSVVRLIEQQIKAFKEAQKETGQSKLLEHIAGSATKVQVAISQGATDFARIAQSINSGMQAIGVAPTEGVRTAIAPTNLDIVDQVVTSVADAAARTIAPTNLDIVDQVVTSVADAAARTIAPTNLDIVNQVAASVADVAARAIAPTNLDIADQVAASVADVAARAIAPTNLDIADQVAASVASVAEVAARAIAPIDLDIVDKVVASVADVAARAIAPTDLDIVDKVVASVADVAARAIAPTNLDIADQVAASVADVADVAARAIAPTNLDIVDKVVASVADVAARAMAPTDLDIVDKVVASVADVAARAMAPTDLDIVDKVVASVADVAARAIAPTNLDIVDKVVASVADVAARAIAPTNLNIVDQVTASVADVAARAIAPTNLNIVDQVTASVADVAARAIALQSQALSGAVEGPTSGEVETTQAQPLSNFTRAIDMARVMMNNLKDEVGPAASGIRKFGSDIAAFLNHNLFKEMRATRAHKVTKEVETTQAQPPSNFTSATDLARVMVDNLKFQVGSAAPGIRKFGEDVVNFLDQNALKEMRATRAQPVPDSIVDIGTSIEGAIVKATRLTKQPIEGVATEIKSAVARMAPAAPSPTDGAAAQIESAVARMAPASADASPMENAAAALTHAANTLLAAATKLGNLATPLAEATVSLVKNTATAPSPADGAAAQIKEVTTAIAQTLSADASPMENAAAASIRADNTLLAASTKLDNLATSLVEATVSLVKNNIATARGAVSPADTADGSSAAMFDSRLQASAQKLSDYTRITDQLRGSANRLKDMFGPVMSYLGGFGEDLNDMARVMMIRLKDSVVSATPKIEEFGEWLKKTASSPAFSRENIDNTIRAGNITNRALKFIRERMASEAMDMPPPMSRDEAQRAVNAERDAKLIVDAIQNGMGPMGEAISSMVESVKAIVEQRRYEMESRRATFERHGEVKMVNQPEIKIEGATSNINVSVNGGQSQIDLDTADIDRIVEALRSDMLGYVDESVRDVYQALDNMRR